MSNINDYIRKIEAENRRLREELAGTLDHLVMIIENNVLSADVQQRLNNEVASLTVVLKKALNPATQPEVKT
jgi:argininosuccinate lyase